MEQRRNTSWELLAGVRFALALIVVLGHIRWLGAPSATFVRACDFCPYTAVLCFLVISGYSMAHSVVTRPAGFLRRRMTRIYPLYALSVLAGLYPAALLHMTSARTWKDVVMNLGFLQTFHALPIVGNGVTWSLAVEAAFYALTPLLARLNTAALLAITSASAVAFLVFPLLHLAYFIDLTHGLPMLFLGWAWLAGFVFYRCRSMPLAGGYLIASMVLMTTANAMFTERRHELTVVLAMLAVVASATGSKVPPRLGSAMSFLGDLSFPLYLFHVPVIFYVVQYRHWVHPSGVAALCAAAGLVMLAVDRLVKRPFSLAVDRVAALPGPTLALVAGGFARARAAGRQMAPGAAVVRLLRHGPTAAATVAVATIAVAAAAK